VSTDDMTDDIERLRRDLDDHADRHKLERALHGAVDRDLGGLRDRLGTVHSGLVDVLAGQMDQLTILHRIEQRQDEILQRIALKG
jgi:hypothetical protein